MLPSSAAVDDSVFSVIIVLCFVGAGLKTVVESELGSSVLVVLGTVVFCPVMVDSTLSTFGSVEVVVGSTVIDSEVAVLESETDVVCSIVVVNVSNVVLPSVVDSMVVRCGSITADSDVVVGGSAVDVIGSVDVVVSSIAVDSMVVVVSTVVVVVSTVVTSVVDLVDSFVVVDGSVVVVIDSGEVVV